MKIRTERPAIRVPGFRFAAARAGLKQSGKRDVALIVSDVPAVAAGAFTTNIVKAAPLLVGIDRLASGRLQALLINSGNANAFTGRDGVVVARAVCAEAARRLRIPERLVFPSSTGRIGVKLPQSAVRRAVKEACGTLSRDGFHDALEGIMTTDAFPKFGVERLALGDFEVTVAGMAKGAGMIAPRMQMAGSAHATMLSYLVTDAAVTLTALRRAVQIALAQSFNAIVVDGDTSTNDTVVLLANGVAGNSPLTERSRDFPSFCGAVGRIMERLARMVVKDGEGATKVIDIHVRGGRSVADATRVADTIARSPLCKSAFYGGDPYAGRIVCAAGYSGARFEPSRLEVYLDKICVVRNGKEVITRAVEARAAAVVAKDEFVLTVDLNAGNALAHRIASDLSVDYVKFNSDYRT